MSLKGRISVLLIRVIGYLPLCLARRLGAMLGWLLWHINSREAKVTQYNIDLCFPALSSSERRQLSCSSLKETAKLAMEICVIWGNDFNWIEKKITKVHGQAILDHAIAQGKGVIVLAPHIGNWEVLGRVLPQYAPTTNLYQPPKQRFIEPLMRESRGRDGAKLAPANMRGVSQLLKALKAGGITGILPDQCPDEGGGIFSPFCGYLAYTITLVHGLLQRTDAKVILALAKRVKGGFELQYIEAPKEIYDADQQVSVDGLNKAIEACISIAPEQYQWEYKRFKMKAPNTKPHYRF